MPQQILIRPDAQEYGLYRGQYEALVTDLEREGVLVRVVPAVEKLPLRRGGSQNAGSSYDLTIQVGAVAGEIIGTTTLVEMVRGRLRRHDGGEDEKRSGKIYLASGEEHAFAFGNGYD